ncbi:hypothetical protein L861_20570 [Litchfieldella anticariensis FP35 = DSM 16096]|uniref:Uncharacterized protein n=1 Tax=Litchfieldella anticariensis (strain DSM 16096 / CECT 5854 / CIP 108499 / LMG 22089 / FP35) TaxID=1121939 RepID=S2KJB3_LITA3|nr:hypothetical protein L861_20570 [Halomonas anticariensis FP35 = DSM 16096]
MVSCQRFPDRLRLAHASIQIQSYNIFAIQIEELLLCIADFFFICIDFTAILG